MPVDPFEGFKEAMQLAVPLTINAKRLEEGKRQFDEQYRLRVAELLQQAEQATDKLAQENLKRDSEMITGLIDQYGQDPQAMQQLGPLAEQLGIPIPKVQKPGTDELTGLPALETQYMVAPQKAESSYNTPIATTEGYYGVNNRTGKVFPLLGKGDKPLMPPAADINLFTDKEYAKLETKYNNELKKEFPQIRDGLNSLNRQWDLVESKIDAAIKMVSPFTAGMGAWIARIPATEQKDLKETLDTIKANIGFDKLQDMRNNSKTGGALGQVSEFENKLLQAVQGSLDQSQSAAQLKSNLEQVKEQLRLTREYKNQSFSSKYKDLIGPDLTTPTETKAKPAATPKPEKTAPQAAIEHLKANPELRDEFKKKYGYLPEGF